ncbi:MAG: tetratricopeptide repeat protein [bacterium]|nr:tetratricopeptide repeat protein [bacterium]
MKSSPLPKTPFSIDTATQRMRELDESIQRWMNDDQHDELTAHYPEILEVANLCEDDRLKGRVFNAYGKYFYRVGQFDYAYISMQRALDSARRLENPQLIGALLNNIGSVFRVRGYFQEALDNFELARTEFQKLGNLLGIANTAGNIAVVYVETEQHQRSIPYFIEAIEFFRELGRKEEEANFLGDYAKVLVFLDQPEQATAMAEKALALMADSNDSYTKGTILNSLGFVYLHVSRFDDAKAALKQALEIHRAMHNQRFIGVTLTNIGFLARTMGNFDAAIEHFREAAELHKEIGDTRGQTISLWNIASVYFNKHRWKECLPILFHISETTPGYQDHVLSIEVLLLRAEVCRQLGDTAEALASIEIVERLLLEHYLELLGVTKSFRALLCLNQGDVVGAEKWLAKANELITPSTEEATAYYWVIKTLYQYTLVTETKLPATTTTSNQESPQPVNPPPQALADLRAAYRKEQSAVRIRTYRITEILKLQHNEVVTKLASLGITPDKEESETRE